MKICRDDMARNNPIWTSAQAEKICACRTRFHWAKESKSDITIIVEAAEAKELMTIPDRLVKADLGYIRTCEQDSSATP